MVLVTLKDPHYIPTCKNVSEKESTHASCSIASAAVVRVTASVSNLNSHTSITALHVRVGPGVVPGLITSSLPHRKCTIKNGVSVGTTAGGSIASTRK